MKVITNTKMNNSRSRQTFGHAPGTQDQRRDAGGDRQHHRRRFTDERRHEEAHHAQHLDHRMEAVQERRPWDVEEQRHRAGVNQRGVVLRPAYVQHAPTNSSTDSGVKPKRRPSRVMSARRSARSRATPPAANRARNGPSNSTLPVAHQHAALGILRNHPRAVRDHQDRHAAARAAAPADPSCAAARGSRARWSARRESIIADAARAATPPPGAADGPC